MSEEEETYKVRTDDWGTLSLAPLIDSHEFWCLYDHLINDESNFERDGVSRDILLQGFKEGNLYGLRVTETDSMYKRNARGDFIFCTDSFYLLPCFCVKDGNKAVIIWTQYCARRMGFARKLVELLKIEEAVDPGEYNYYAREFWKKLNIKIQNT